jgi:hypothetical protein
MSGMNVYHKQSCTELMTMMWKDWGLQQEGKDPQNNSWYGLFL